VAVNSDQAQKLLHAICFTCKANVQAFVIGQHVDPVPVEFGPGDQDELFARISMLVCPACNSCFVVRQALASSEDVACDDWPEAQRLWPHPENTISYRIPRPIRDDLVEAEKCLHSGVYTASVAMSGRALEGLVRTFTTPTTYLKTGFQELHEKNLIDKRLLEWGEALHLERNEGAHASGRSYNERDATDILEFSKSIIEYVFDISIRFQRFKERREKREARAQRNLADESKQPANS
jgi:HEPN domain-containing protein